MATRRRLGRPTTRKAVVFEGIPEIVANANKLMRASGYGGGDIAREYKSGLMTGALIIRDEARDLVHKDERLLEKSIFAAHGDPKKPNVIVGVNTRQAVSTTKAGETRTYAGIEEYGNDERPPHPYMRPAITSTKPVVVRVLKEKLESAVEKLADRLIK